LDEFATIALTKWRLNGRGVFSLAILALVVGSNFQDLQVPKNGALNSKKMP